MKKPSAATSRQSAVPSGWPQSAARYAVAAADATSASLPWREEAPLFTNACEETVWVEISAANYATLTNKAVVKIVEREPLRLWYANEDLQLQTATAWDGYLFDSDEAVVGTIRVRVGRPGRGSSLCRQAVEVKLAGEKTLRLSRRAVFDGRLEMTVPCVREGRRPRRNGLRHRDGQGRRQLAGHRRIARGAHAAPEIARVRRTGTQSGT